LQKSFYLSPGGQTVQSMILPGNLPAFFVPFIHLYSVMKDILLKKKKI